MEPFLSEEEWKTAREFEGTLRETSCLVTICQNEEKSNSACGSAMRKVLCDSSSRGTTSLAHVDD